MAKIAYGLGRIETQATLPVWVSDATRHAIEILLRNATQVTLEQFAAELVALAPGPNIAAQFGSIRPQVSGSMASAGGLYGIVKSAGAAGYVEMEAGRKPGKFINKSGVEAIAEAYGVPLQQAYAIATVIEERGLPPSDLADQAMDATVGTVDAQWDPVLDAISTALVSDKDAANALGWFS